MWFSVCMYVCMHTYRYIWSPYIFHVIDDCWYLPVSWFLQTGFQTTQYLKSCLYRVSQIRWRILWLNLGILETSVQKIRIYQFIFFFYHLYIKVSCFGRQCNSILYFFKLSYLIDMTSGTSVQDSLCVIFHQTLLSNSTYLLFILSEKLKCQLEIENILCSVLQN